MPDGTAAEFPVADEAQWHALVHSVLKGRPFDRLVSRSYDGIEIQPLYARANGPVPRALRRKAGDWRVVQRMDHPDAFEANRQALSDLAQGADALSLVGSESGAGWGFGVKLARASDFETALAGIDLDLISLRLDLGPQTPAVAQWFLELARRRHLVSTALDIDICFDPIGDLLRHGSSPLSAQAIGQTGADLARRLRDAGFASRVFLADGRPFHEAGASQAQELALVLAGAVTYLRMLEGNGLALEHAVDEIGFLLVADADQFLTIAKFRALRRLWAHIAEACGVAAVPARIHAETAWRMETLCDPWVNILRGALAAFSAGIGGADAIAVLPFTQGLGLADEFARRIARNSQLILLHESHLGNVADPAAGAGSFEELTAELCEKAWRLFQTIETSGGLIESVQAGVPQAWIATSAAARAKALARRTEVLTGTSEFPNLAETPVAVLAPRPAAKTKKTPGADRQLEVTALPSERDSEIFESLRQVCEAELAARGVRPRIFLANLGPQAGFSARSGFAAAVFAVAGLEAASAEAGGSIEALRDAFATSGAKIACICAADTQLESDGHALALALREAGARHVFIAADPKTSGLPADWAQLAGVTFLYRGCDIVAILQNALAFALD
jgi:methylmalonyl-CoA mutase